VEPKVYTSPIHRYHVLTKGLLYSFLAALPLFIIYEVLIMLTAPTTEVVVRISVDVWFKQLLQLFGLDALNISLLLVLIAGIFILIRKRRELNDLRVSYFIVILVESIAWAVLVALVSSTLTSWILPGMAEQSAGSAVQLSYIQQLALSLGAGLYEELFFRVLLVSAFIWIFSKWFGAKSWASYISAILLSAVLFSAVHYTGNMGDLFTMSSFLFRFLFGVILNGIYVWRGFGVAAWTHAIYDVIVITFLGA
jgi:membrane protease YdiL (CAAX protease family)